MAVKPIPDGFHSVTPYWIVPDAAKLIDFLKAAYDAKEDLRHLRPDGSIMHAQVTIGDSPIMMGQANEQWKPILGSVYLYVPDVDATYKRALGAGATSLMEPMDQYYGDRSAGVVDPCGNVWWIATHKEDVSSEELARRQAAQAK